MKIYHYCCSVTMGDISIQGTEMQKKAMANFLKSFSLKPHISKMRCGESANYDYVYSTEIVFDSPEYLRVLRFSESLRAFCSFWRMSLIEHCFNKIDSDFLMPE